MRGSRHAWNQLWKIGFVKEACRTSITPSCVYSTAAALSHGVCATPHSIACPDVEKAHLVNTAELTHLLDRLRC